MSRTSGPFAALAWIAACLLGALALMGLLALLLGAFASQLWINLTAVAMLAGAALLFLPPLWRMQKSRWLRAVRVIFAAVLAYVGAFLLPVTSHTIKPDMPRSHRAP